MGREVCAATDARNSRPMPAEPPVSMTATHVLPTMKPRLAMSSWPGVSSGSGRPICTKTPGAGSLRLKPSRTAAAQTSGHASSQAAMRDSAAPIGRGVMCLRLRIQRVDRDGQGQCSIGGDSQRRILAQGYSRVRVEQRTAASVHPNVGDIMGGNGVAGPRIYLETGRVGVPNADLYGFGIGRGPYADLAQFTLCRCARRRRAAPAGFHPGAAHLQGTVGFFGDGTHGGKPIDAHAHVDFGHGRARKIERRNERRRIVVDEYADALDPAMLIVGEP